MTHTIKTVMLFLLCIVVALNVTAQSYSFKNYTTNDGLVQTDITAITQDKKGNIWIGTNGGISIFDGKKFTNYDDHDLLQSLRINALLCDSSGYMWIATRNGLLKYDNGFQLFFKPNSNQNNPVTSLTANSQNNLLFVCANIIYQVKNNKVEKYKVNNSVETNAAFVAYDRDDNLWIVTNDLRIYRKSFNILTPIRTFFTPELRKRGMGILKLLGKEGPVPYFISNFGTLWVQDDSLQYFNKQYLQFPTARIGQATYVLQHDDSTVWVGGTVGLSKLSGASATRFSKDNGFCDNSVSCIFTDRERNLWVGCTYNGVYKLSNEALFHVKPPAEPNDLNHISAIVPLNNGNAIVSTWGKGLFLYDRDTISRISLPPSIRYITNIFSVGEKSYLGWFGKGLWRLDHKTLMVSPVAGFAKDEAVDQMFKVGGSLLFQTLDYTCYLTDFDLNVKVAVKLPEDHVVTVLKDKIYLLSPFGQVDILNSNLEVVKKNIFPEISSRITEMTCFRDNFLIGTFGQGLFVYNQWGKLLKRIDKKSGLNTNIITSLLVDGSTLFMGSNLGLIKGELPELTKIKSFKETEGMFNWECRPGGLEKLSNGAISIATTNGLYIYYPHKDVGNQYTSGVLTVSDIVFGSNAAKRIYFSSIMPFIQLPGAIDYDDNRVTITLNGVSQRNPGEIVYHYQLQGYDSMWIGTADPVIKLSDLNPGHYKLRAYMSVGDFNSKPVSVAFSIAKPLSGELWFQVLLILFLSLICWSLLTVGNRIYQKYIQTKMLSKLESEIALKQQLTARSISFAKHNYKELSEAIRMTSNEKQLDHLTPTFLNDISKRIELLWSKDQITLGEFHQYFDELLSNYATGAKLYHKFSLASAEIPMAPAFHLLQFFSLYLIFGVYENGDAVFSLDTENKSNGHLFFRFYTITHVTQASKTCTYHFLKEAIERQHPVGVTIDVIENLEYGNMVIGELNLQNENRL